MATTTHLDIHLAQALAPIQSLGNSSNPGSVADKSTGNGTSSPSNTNSSPNPPANSSSSVLTARYLTSSTTITQTSPMPSPQLTPFSQPSKFHCRTTSLLSSSLAQRQGPQLSASRCTEGATKSVRAAIDDSSGAVLRPGNEMTLSGVGGGEEWHWAAGRL
jgi:hypothetical protein